MAAGAQQVDVRWGPVHPEVLSSRRRYDPIRDAHSRLAGFLFGSNENEPQEWIWCFPRALFDAIQD